jgi:hypothetical protein
MRRSALHPFVTAAVVGVIAVSPAACDSTLNLGDAADGGSAASNDGAVFAATCAGVCDKVIACALLSSTKRAACVSDCMTSGAPQSLLDCAAVTPCASLQATCSAGLPDAAFPDTSPPAFDSGQEEFEVMNCQHACDSLKSFSCLDASEQAMCRDLCATASKSKRNTFYSCGEAVASQCPKARECYAVFVGD